MDISGIRGSFEEGEPVLQKATFIGGFYETWPIEYGEEAYGFAKTGQTMLPVTDACTIKLFVDDESFSLRHAYVIDYERALDFKNGTLDRTLIWDTAAGKKVKNRIPKAGVLSGKTPGCDEIYRYHAEQ